MSDIGIISHNFIGGVYAKHMTIPEGHKVVTHKHEYDHMSILSQGVVAVEVNGETEIYAAPAVIEIKAGVEHSVTPIFGYGEAVWFCIHKTDETDEAKVDNVLIKKQHMKKLPFSFDTQNALDELAENPDLWNQIDFRTKLYENSPHREVSDIILRYRDYAEFDADDAKHFSDKHESIWWDAIEKLPEVRKLIDSIMWQMPSHAELGGVLITKIPAGKQVYPHSDAGHWHPEYYRKKVLVLLQSAKDQSFNFDGESHTGISGEVFEFDNLPVHWVINESPVDRISLILAIRDGQNDD